MKAYSYAMILSLLFCYPVQSQVRYVNWDATGSNNGTSWTNAYTDLQAALAAAVYGDEIWVVAGTYKPTTGTDRYQSFTLRNGVAIYGGFNGTEASLSERNWLQNVTTLSGDIGVAGDNSDNSYHVLVGSGTDATTVIDGFTARDGHANAPYPAFWPHMHGAGMLNMGGGSPVIRNVIFFHNNADNRGGAVVNEHATPTFVNVTLIGNTSGSMGGGMYNYNNGNATLVNVVFSGNTAPEGGAVYNYTSNPTFVNTTFSANTATTSGGAISNYSCTPVAVNCVVWGNTPDQIANSGGATLTMTYSDVQGGCAGTGNINSDPFFVDPDGFDNIAGTLDDDLTLLATSPCIDAGNNAAVPVGITEDPSRYSRFVNVPTMPDVGSGTPPLVDMGPYEVQVRTVTLTSFAPTSGPVGTVVTINGSGFSATPSNNVVYFGATKAAVTGATSTSMTVTVPVGATYKPISVTTGGLTAYSAKPFVVTFTSAWVPDLLAFASKVDFSIESNSGGMVVADFDGDGKADVAVSNTTSNMVSIFRNTSTAGSITAGSFAAKVDFAAGCSPASLIAVDLDGDGKMDLAWENVGASKVGVLRNTSTPGILSFATVSEYTSCPDAEGLTAGDLDGDGLPELIVAKYNGVYPPFAAIMILPNTGSLGSISLGTPVGLGSGSPGEWYNPAIADIDGDGKPDIIATYWSGHAVGVWRNRCTPGSFSFADVSTFGVYQTGSNPAIGDIDRDGKADIVIIDGSGVSVLPNTSSIGSISFGTKVDFAVSGNLGSSTVADVTGDGKLDIVVTNSGRTSVSIFRNTSTPGVINSGTLASQVDLVVGSGPNMVEVGDIDGDGVPDIVSSNYTGRSFSVLRNRLGETHVAITGLAPPSGPVGTTVTITGTGFSTTPLNNVVYFGATRGTVTGATSTSVTVTVPIGATFKPLSVTTGGLTAYSAKPFVVTFTPAWVPDPLAFATKVDFSIESECGGVVVADFDGDGKADVAVSNTTSNMVSIFRNTSGAGDITTGSFATKVDFAAGCSPAYLIAVDLDCDGKMDLAWENVSADKVGVLRNMSTVGTISFTAYTEYTSFTSAEGLTSGDLDGDGRPELAVARYNGVFPPFAAIMILPNTGSPGTISFGTPVGLGSGSPGEWYNPAIADIDGDGKPEIIATYWSGWAVGVWRNRCTPGSFSFADVSTFGVHPTGSNPAIGDIDGDGKPDIVIINNNAVSVLPNTSSIGSISFSAKVDFAVTGNPGSSTLSDVTGDGKLDIVVTNSGRTSASIFRNTSTPGVINSGTLASQVDLVVGSGPNMVEVGDIDGDGVPDIVSSNYNGNSFSVLRNDRFTIAASVTGPGTLAPSGDVKVAQGSDATFSIAADPGYVIAHVLMDGVEQGCVASYTFHSVIANHTIAATFLPPPTEVFVDATYTLGNSGGHAFGYDAFSSIQPAIDIAAVGGTVHVAGGIYTESVNLNKTLQLLGARSTTTTINAGGSLNDGVTISVDGVTMSGFTVTNCQNGVVIGGNRATVKNCAFTSYSQNGVKVNVKDNAVIRHNTMTGTASTNGLLLYGAQQCVVSSNTISGNAYNVKVQPSPRSARNNQIRANTLTSPVTWSIEVGSDPALNKVNFNVFGPASSDKYVRNASATILLNAEYNWFGGETTTLGGAGDFDGSVDYTNSFATNATISIFPASQYVGVGVPVSIDVMGLIPAGTYVKGSDITLTWSDDANIPNITGASEGDFFDDGVGPTIFAANPSGTTGNTVLVNQSLLNNAPPGGVGTAGPLPYVGVLFSMTFQASATATSTLTLSDIQLRNPSNAAITPVDVLPVGGATLIADGTNPTVTNVVIDNTTLNTDQNNDTFDDYVKNTDNVQVTATVSDNNPLTTADIVADFTPFGGGPAVVAGSYVGTLATWTLNNITCTPTDGTITITVTATDVVSLTGTASDDITSDNTLPTAPTDFVAKTDPAGGHQKVALSWTAGTDAHYKGMVAKYVTRTYPTYTNDPAYPADASQGTAAAGSPFAGTSATHAIAERAIYKYTAFSVDWAGNYSTAATSAQQDRAANYFLGDLGSGEGENLPGLTGYNGRVNFDDLAWFSNLYFTSSGSWNGTNNGAEVDFGPTTSNKSYAANHRFALPTPDGAVNFEDLMIFSMNYLNTTPKITEPADRRLAQQLAIELYNSRSTTQQGEMVTVTVGVANDGREIKGVAVTLNFDPSVMQFVDATSGGLFGSEQQGFLFAKAENNKVQIDAAVLGMDRTTNFSGNLAVIRFRALQAGQGQVTIASATVRGGDNNEQQPALNNNAFEPPTTFSLAQNYPNPFNPSTRIDYQVPATSPVTVGVFNVLGEKVATLVNETKQAGYYNVVWNGRNTNNTQVASGLYFCKMQADKFSSVKKMMLVK